MNYSLQEEFISKMQEMQRLAAAQTKAEEAVLRIFDALRTGTAVQFVYTDQDGIISLRNAIPTTVRKCQNGRVIVEAHDLHRKAERQFRMGSIALIG